MTIKEIKKRLNTQEKEGSVKDNRLDVIETRIEENEQLRRDENIIIIGLEQNQTSRDDVKKFLNDKLDTKNKAGRHSVHTEADKRRRAGK